MFNWEKDMSFSMSIMKLIGKYAKTALKRKELKKLYMKE